MTKSTRLETDTRVETVRQFILRGDETSDIVRAAAETWGIKDRQAWYYIEKAREKIKELTELARPYLIAEHIAIRRDIRMRAQKANNLYAELAAAQDEAKLFGLYPSEKIELTDWRAPFLALGLDPDAARRKLVDIEVKLLEPSATLPHAQQQGSAALQSAEIPHDTSQS